MQGTSLANGQPADLSDTRVYGSVAIVASRTVEGGYAINAYTATGGHRYDTLAYSTRDRAAYRARYAQIRDLALQGLSGDEIADRINGPARQAVNAAEQVITNALADLNTLGHHRQVRPTMAGAHLAPLSESQQRILTQAATRGGTISRGRNATVTQLQALARKGYMTLNYLPGRRLNVASGTLTDRGWREAGVAR